MNQPTQIRVGVDWKTEAGPLRPLLNDNTVSEIMVNRWDRIFIERTGVIEETRLRFNDSDALSRFVHAAAAAVGRELNRKIPYLEAAFADGTRLTIVIPPIAVDGPSINIRKPARSAMTYKDLVNFGAFDEKAVFFLHQMVLAKQNVIISGGTGSGKTTLLSVLSSFIPPTERVVSIEDTPELQVQVRNLVRLETRPPMGSEDAITMENLLKSALRMRPDRIMIGECRGAEAIDMLMAMNTGHSGSMTTVHANSTIDALRRLESMVLRSGFEAPLSMIQADIASTIHFILQAERGADGKRRIVQITEVTGQLSNKDYETHEVFAINLDTGKPALKTTGHVPRFIAQKTDPRVNFPTDFFHPDKVITLA